MDGPDWVGRKTKCKFASSGIECGRKVRCLNCSIHHGERLVKYYNEQVAKMHCTASSSSSSSSSNEPMILAGNAYSAVKREIKELEELDKRYFGGSRPITGDTAKEAMREFHKIVDRNEEMEAIGQRWEKRKKELESMRAKNMKFDFENDVMNGILKESMQDFELMRKYMTGAKTKSKQLSANCKATVTAEGYQITWEQAESFIGPAAFPTQMTPCNFLDSILPKMGEVVSMKGGTVTLAVGKKQEEGDVRTGTTGWIRPTLTWSRDISKEVKILLRKDKDEGEKAQD